MLRRIQNRPRNIIDTIPGCVLGVSTQFQLRGSYGGQQLAVRRSSDNEEQRFFPSESKERTPLTGFVGAGNDGFLPAIYDQSGFGRHAVQTSASAQPMIVDDGSAVELDGRLAGEFDGESQWMEFPASAGLLPSLAAGSGFTMVVSYLNFGSGANVGVPPFFGNNRGFDSVNPGSFGLGGRVNSGNVFIRNEISGSTSIDSNEFTFAAGQYMRVSCTLDTGASIGRIYINGVFRQEVDFTGFDISSPHTLKLFHGTASNGNISSGRIHAGKFVSGLVFNRPISDAEQLYIHDQLLL